MGGEPSPEEDVGGVSPAESRGGCGRRRPAAVLLHLRNGLPYVQFRCGCGQPSPGLLCALGDDSSPGADVIDPEKENEDPVVAAAPMEA